jgi:arylsulfatase A-like enzyme
MKINKSHKIIGGFLIFVVLLGFVFFFNRKTSPPPDVILITIDALRADHLSGYGYPRKTSPNIDDFAKGGVTFLNCFASSSTTVSATPGLMTGRYLMVTKFEPFWDHVLDKRFTTLAEYLNNFGFYTAAFLSNVIYRKGTGFEQGFDYFFVHSGIDARKLNTEVLRFLNKPSRDKPVFIWVHYLEPHAPYEFRKRYFKDFEGDRLYKENDKILQVKPDNVDVGKYFREWTSSGYIPPIVFHKDRYNRNYYIACYDSEIAYVDFWIGDLLKNIKDNTLIILTADHGESMGEHNTYFNHGENTYDEELHIPLIIKDNRYFKGGKIISRVVSGVDIVPTILNRINPIWYFFNKNKFNGIDLKLIVENKPLQRQYIYSYYWGARSIRDINKNIKYILNEDGQEELYILLDETENLIKDASPEIISVKDDLRKNLKLWRKAYPIFSDINTKKVSLDEDTKAHLRSLGYLQ